MSELLAIEKRASVAIVRFNRPEKQNAFNMKLLAELNTALANLEDEHAIRGIVLTGGEKVFSSGADLDQALATKTIDDTRRWLEAFRVANAHVESLTKPVIAAINGFCLTGGLELALCCDIRVAGAGTRFGITSSRIGSVAGAGGTQRLARLIGPEWTKEMLFSGNFVDAETALRIGIVSEVVAPEMVIPRAIARLESYVERAPLSIAYAKLAVNRGLQMDLESWT